MPAGAKKVDRATRWGNPFRLVPQDPQSRAYRKWAPDPDTDCTTADEAVLKFSDMLHCEQLTQDFGYPSLAEIQDALAGKDLACWCPVGTPCHADVLLRVANTPRQNVK